MHQPAPPTASILRLPTVFGNAELKEALKACLHGGVNVGSYSGHVLTYFPFTRSSVEFSGILKET